MKAWSSQVEKCSYAVACQEMVARQLTGENISEERMIAFAQEQGWYDPESGTTMYNTGRLLETMGMRVECETGVSVGDLAQPALTMFPGLKANHAVWVTEIDISDPENIEVFFK